MKFWKGERAQELSRWDQSRQKSTIHSQNKLIFCNKLDSSNEVLNTETSKVLNIYFANA